MNIVYKQNSSNQGLVNIIEHDGWFYVFVEECEYDYFSNFQDDLRDTDINAQGWFINIIGKF